jgi:putative endonuclease
VNRQYYVYIITNIANTVLYTGVTNNLIRRIAEHREGKIQGFSKRYFIHKLVYYEATGNIEDVIREEKRIKRLLRKQKEVIINDFNPEWRDLYLEITG